MKIVQIVTNLNWGDAIGSDVLAMDDTLRSAGYACGIMTLTVDERLKDRAGNVDFSAIDAGDMVVFHKATGDDLSAHIAGMPCRKALVYHNITPAGYILPYDAVMAWNLWRGRKQLKRLAAGMDWAWCDSAYNSREIVAAGMPEDRVSVLPILRRSPAGKTAADPQTAERLRKEKGTKLLFIGRIAPNKKHEDVIKVFYRYLQTRDEAAKLYFVGDWQGFEKYYAKLKGFAAELALRDDQAVFTGKVTEEEKNAYLDGADALICMSEHEGFCIPLLEAMEHDLPVVAYAAAAVPETLGDNGLLFGRKDPLAIAGAVGRLREDARFRESVLAKQRENLKRFDDGATERRLLELTARALGSEKRTG